MMIIFSITPTVIAQTNDYVPLASLPGIGGSNGETTTLQTYLPAIFKLTIGVAAVMAFVVITFGGITYIVSDTLTGKEDGRRWVENAVWGLLLVIGAYAILYTINPEMLSFKLTIPRPQTSITPPTSTVSGTGNGVSAAGGKGVGCQGDCRYSYVNSSGVTVSYRDCSSCSDATSFGLKIKNTVINGQNAKIDTTLGNQLKGIQNSSGAPSFEVTETWPPTVRHAAQGQYDGTSVDVGLLNPSVSNINNFIDKAKSQGLRVVYEVSTPSQAQSYISKGVPSSNIISVVYITGEHFSVYKN